MLCYYRIGVQLSQSVQMSFPTSQGQLVKTSRGDESRDSFAKKLGVSRSSLSRYENEKLGVPTRVLNFCLLAISAPSVQQAQRKTPVDRALELARETVNELESAAKLGTQKRKRGSG
jgi:transcriptional regulator with XRE-family HTH domain